MISADASDLANDSIPRVRRRTPSPSLDRKRRRGDTIRSPSSGDSARGSRFPEVEPTVPRVHRHVAAPKSPATPYGGRAPPQPQAYGNGVYGAHQPFAGVAYPRAVAPQQPNKSRRLYAGNINNSFGLTEIALQQFFSALYCVGFRPNKPDEPLPVLSVWLHSDGKFGFMELRGDQEAVNMMQLNGIFLHGRPLRINRPSDYRPEMYPAALNLVPEPIKMQGIVELCNQLGGIASPPARLLAVAAANVTHGQGGNDMRERVSISQTPMVPEAPKSVAGTKAESMVQAPANGNAITSKPRPLSTINLRSQPSPMKQVEAIPGAENGLSKPAAHVSGETKSEPTGAKSNPSTVDTSKDEEKHEVVKTTPPLTDGDAEAPKSGRVISLVNLVTNEDLEGNDEDYEDLVDDVKVECSQYGTVTSVEIPRTGEWKGTAFIEFSRAKDANTAVSTLRARVFDGRQISAEIVKGCISALSASSRITADK